jgi:serine/threonine protein kinase/Tfp pilus assembly protein PilF
MTSIDEARLAEVLARAEEFGPRERLEFLRNTLGDETPELERALEALGIDPASSGAQAWEEFASPDRSGTEIDAWKLILRLGGGGMGEVYLAERRDDYSQRVAIKLVRPDLVSTAIRTRLRAERQILARLSHANIARLLDGGTTPEGIPYLVMEYIEGLPIDAYCDQHKLSIEARLGLIRQVCSAVHAAHQNLVVHRDLKPSNILVTAEGIPKLLDFGIAKLLDVKQTSHTLAMTQADVRLMTPDHASPEQVRGEAITTASDVYVLGVLMYELLGGRRPFRIRTLRVADIERAICSEDPTPPSVALDPRRGVIPAPSAEEIAAARSTTVRRLKRDLRGDLDNIVLLAMRKEPERRYSSAEQLSADIGRHLDGEPVIARPDSWGYRASKFVGRYTLAVSLSGAIALLLVAFSVSLYLQNQQVERERAVSEQERERYKEVARFLVGLFKLSDPAEARGRNVSAREILDRGAERVSRDLKSQPQTQATLMEAIGRVYLQLGSNDLARPQIEGSLERRRMLLKGDHAEMASSLVAAGELEFLAGHYDTAERFYRDALAMYERLYGHDNLDVADTVQRLGQVLKVKGQTREAKQAFEDSLYLFTTLEGSETASVSSVLNELAQLETQENRYDEAEKLLRRTLAIEEKLLGVDAPQVIYSRHNLADALRQQGRLAEARPIYEQSLAQLRKVMGDRHPATIDALGNFGRFLQESGELDEAERYFRESLDLNRGVRGVRHPYVGYDLVNIGNLLRQRGDLHGAESAFNDALRIYAVSLPDDHLYIASAQAGRARVFLDSGRARDALLAADSALAIRVKQLTPGNVQIAEARALQGRALMLLNRTDAARGSLELSLQELRAGGLDTDRRAREAELWLAELDGAKKSAVPAPAPN